MTGLFVYHVRCLGCGLTGPPIGLHDALWRPNIHNWPAADSSTGRFVRVEVSSDDFDGESASLAERLSTSTRRVSVPR
ncbi:MAG: hypothetical protein HC927_07125, partial [Deltaproteobacteria bacterium]|nr:hypothetical protein [Deltaproteobacteria bacterium]